MIDKPEQGKVYALTGAKGTKCIAHGNRWSESEVHLVTIKWGTEGEDEDLHLLVSAGKSCVHERCG